MGSDGLSPEERQVVAAMRASQRHGNAIYNYALALDSYDDYPDDPDPWRPD